MTAELELDVDPGPPPIERGGPYSSVSGRVLTSLPPGVRNVATEAGGIAQLLGQVIWSAIRHPRGYWGDVVDEMHFTLKKSLIPIVLALTGFLLTLSVPSIKWVANAGITELFAPYLFAACTRTFTVWMATLLVAGVVGASMTAELGSRKVREELDAMKVMGIDPIRVLVLPRIISVTLVTMLLAVPAALITILSGFIAAWSVTGVNWQIYESYVWLAQSPVSIGGLLINCFIGGLLTGGVCCYKGLNAAGGATGLGRAVNQAVIISFVMLFVVQLVYVSMLLGFFPDVGLFR